MAALRRTGGNTSRDMVTPSVKDQQARVSVENVTAVER
jgi:hypothetical protein